MDAIDREILIALMENARASYRELGERVALSANATAERVRRLQDAGVIRGFTTIVDPAAAGRTLSALMDVRLRGPQEADGFERLVRTLEPVTEVTHVTGRFDYQVRVECRDTTELDSLLRTLKSKGGVAETDTRLGLRTILRRPQALTGT